MRYFKTLWEHRGTQRSSLLWGKCMSHLISPSEVMWNYFFSNLCWKEHLSLSMDVDSSEISKVMMYLNIWSFNQTENEQITNQWCFWRIIFYIGFMFNHKIKKYNIQIFLITVEVKLWNYFPVNLLSTI